MRKMQRNRGPWALGATVLGVCVMATVASAADYDVTTEQAGSIIVFPKVVWDGAGGRDTLIQIANTGSMPAMAHCFYLDGRSSAQCAETDFYIFLTRQQPTHWVASSGRAVSWGGGAEPPDGAGFDPGRVPPVPTGFTGQLLCVQVDPDSLEPWKGNQLKGDAILKDAAGDVSKYNAITFRGNGSGAAAANHFELDLNWTGANATGAYSSCPNELRVGHAAGGAREFANTEVRTEFTLVPCYEDLENQIPGKAKVAFTMIDEYEVAWSLPVQTVSCWFSKETFEISSLATITGGFPTLGAQMIIKATPADGSIKQDVGVIGVVEEYRVPTSAASPRTGHAASAMIGVGNRPATTPPVDQFILPQP